uniref:Peptidoglycan D,D-transpeptidase FtsI homolog n=1 Tax=Chlorokybus atmophyticus TaxID=3144 RepID=FTSIH_CHLAT|nr:penicillin-binding protein [Chlorokybus atmophyticus]A2CI41.1 RecName: Full=Peptidoglycan D,D-transpeptidase FtsI homolog [Chlorokybus atmophyticus]ABM87954.1 penicillin-binding protein [Chlorokybus atmophyticus]
MKPYEPKSWVTRVFLVWWLTALSCFFISGRLIYLQLLKGKWLKEKALKQQTVTLKTFQPRRNICDRNGIPLAIDTLAYDVFAHPLYFSISIEEVANKLSPILCIDSLSIQKLLKPTSTGICLASQLPENTGKLIASLRLDGIDLIKHPKRYYPYKEIVGNVIGYVDTSHQGQAGIELSCQESLQLNSPTLTSSIDGRGVLISHQIPKELFIQDNLSLQLTLDLELQKIAYKALKQGLENCKGKRGTVLILDPKTGGILTLVALPSYDPNIYYDFPIERFKPWPVTDLYEPGSTFKPLNIAIALETKAISPEDSFYDEGCIRVGDSIITNNDYNSYKPLPCLPNTYNKIVKLLANSSNVGMVHILERIAPEIYHSWLSKLDLGHAASPLETDLPWASESSLKDINEFVCYEIEPAAASFGQGLAMTPIKLAQLYASLANGGILVKPYLVTGLANAAEDTQKAKGIDLPSYNIRKKNLGNHLSWHKAEPSYLFLKRSGIRVTDLLRHIKAEGRFALPFRKNLLQLFTQDAHRTTELQLEPKAHQPQLLRPTRHAVYATNQSKRVFSHETTKLLLDMLEDVIWNGTGSSCFVEGYRIGGKTGTSQKHTQEGGYSKTKIITSFAAIFPTEDPQYVILTVIDEPNIPLSFGSNTAAPIVKSIIESLIDIKKMKPTIPIIKVKKD